MTRNLGEAKSQARAFFRAGDHPQALAVYDRLLAAAPFDHDLRLKIADVLAAAGLGDQAAEIYRAVAQHDIRSGHPLPAIVAAQALLALGQPADDIFALLASSYACGSSRLARLAMRRALPEPEIPIAASDTPTPLPFDRLVARAHQRALDLSAAASYPEQYQPLPFFSEFGPEEFTAVLKALSVKRFTDGEVVITQGEVGHSLYLIAAGEVRVFDTASDGAHGEIARLHENSLFGEMALVTEQPRAASVAVVGEADVVAVSRAALEQLTARLPALGEALARFTRERLIKNLLVNSPLFRPFTKPQQADLLRRFESQDVPSATSIIREGEAGRGLFIVLSGKAEVVKGATGTQPVILATLHPGEVFGEMSLVSAQPTSATVRTVGPATVLFLARGYVARLAAAVPEVQQYFESLAVQRSRDNSTRLRRRTLPVDATEIDITEAILL